MQAIRILTAAAFAAGIMLVAPDVGRSQSAGAPSCGETTFASNGVVLKVMFAKNGAVQQYLVAVSSHNAEHDHDALLAAQAKYGPEAIDAPPVRIISFKPGGGGMMIPDQAVDSCGRITHFH